MARLTVADAKKRLETRNWDLSLLSRLKVMISIFETKGTPSQWWRYLTVPSL